MKRFLTNLPNTFCALIVTAIIFRFSPDSDLTTGDFLIIMFLLSLSFSVSDLSWKVFDIEMSISKEDDDGG